MDIFLCPISKIKKEFQKVHVFSIFLSLFLPLKIAIYPPKINISCFLHCFHVFRGTFCIKIFSLPNLFYLNKLFVFLSYIKHKYLIKHIFFIKNIPINYPSLSKIIQKLSIRSRKNPKKLKKSPKNHFFLLFFLWSHHCFCKMLYYHLT